MRTIKFRAWDNDYKKMVQSIVCETFELGISFEGKVIGFEQENSTKEKPASVGTFPARFSPMQFTGLKDKNGKEIYEGDILRFQQMVLFSRKEGEKYEITEAEVVWYEGYGLSGFTLKVTGKHHLHTLDATKGEVIGNIYENGCAGIRKKPVESAP